MIEYANGLDFSDIETTEQTINYLDYINTVDDIWYCYGTDNYYFSESE